MRSREKAKTMVRGPTLPKNMVMSRITCEGVLSHEVIPIERPQVEKADISSKSTLIGSLSLSKYIIDTGRPNNGGTEAINELHQRVARGSRNRYRSGTQSPVIGGGLTHPHLR